MPAAKEAKKKAAEPVAAPQKSETAAAKSASDPGSIDFDITEWLQEADEVARATQCRAGDSPVSTR